MVEYAKQTCHGRWMRKDYEPGVVSVIIPTYNRAEFLTEAIDSVFAQTYRPLELIVVDDGSTDDTKAAVDSWRRDHSQDRGFSVHYFRQEKKGAQVARNRGLIESHGEFIQFLDSDDLLHCSKIANQVSVIESCEPKTVVYGDLGKFRLADNSVEIYVYKTRRVGPEADLLKLWLGNWPKNPHLYLWQRMDLYHLGPWDESLIVNQDVDYGTRFVLQGGKFAYCPQAWAYYRIYESPADTISGSKSRKYWESKVRVITKTEEALIEKGTLEQYRSALSSRYYVVARQAATSCKDTMKFCLRKFYQLSPTHKVPGGFNHRFLSRLLGLPLKEKVSCYLSSKFAFHCKKPVASVENVRQLYSR